MSDDKLIKRTGLEKQKLYHLKCEIEETKLEIEKIKKSLDHMAKKLQSMYNAKEQLEQILKEIINE